MIQKVAVIGIGLIGGSFCLALKKYRPNLEIIGFDQPEVLNEAFKRKAIDLPAPDLKEAVKDADLVVLAVPISQILRFISEIAPSLKEGAIVTDVGSVKHPIVQHARNALPSYVTFVGGHPMAGSEKSGLTHADPFLFENATYVLCPPDTIDDEQFVERHEQLIGIVEALGARIIILQAERHDRIAAAVSHLPQLLAVTLTNFVGRLNDADDAFLRLAAGGFRDMTRIAGSRFDIWHDILGANEGPILDMLAGFATDLQKLRNKVFTGEAPQLQQEFRQARASRNLIPQHSKGFLHPLADVYVYAEDKPGFLFRLTQIIHEAEINIKDLELLKIREGLEGVFRIGFENDAAASSAIDALKREGYEAFRM